MGIRNLIRFQNWHHFSLNLIAIKTGLSLCRTSWKWCERISTLVISRLKIFSMPWRLWIPILPLFLIPEYVIQVGLLHLLCIFFVPDFVAALLQTRLRFHEDAIREAFLKFDVDRSGLVDQQGGSTLLSCAGYITADDLRQVIGDSFEGVNVNDVVQAADSNGDGRIGIPISVWMLIVWFLDYEEFLAAVLAEVQADAVPSRHAVPSATAAVTTPTVEEALEDERAEAKQRVLKQLLGVVDTNLAERDRIGGIKMMTYVLSFSWCYYILCLFCSLFSSLSSLVLS